MIYALLNQNLFNFSTSTVPSPGRFPELWCAFCWQFHHFRNISLPFCWPFNYASVENFMIITYQTFPGRFMTISSHFVHAFKTVSWPSQIFLYHFLATLRQFFTISWPLKTPQGHFLTISNHLLSIFRLFPGGFPTSSQPFLLQAIFVKKTDHITNNSQFVVQFRAISWPSHTISGCFMTISWPFEAVTWSFQAVSWPIHDHSCRFLTISGHFRATSVTFLPFILAIFTQFLTI